MIEQQRKTQNLTLWAIIGVLVAVLGGYVYLAWQSHGQSQELSAQLQAIRNDIITEVAAERERRLSELHDEVKTEQRRQDAVTADIATKANQRASVAEGKAEVAKGEARVAKTKAAAGEKRLKRVEKVVQPFMDHPRVVEKIVKDVAPLVPEPPIAVPTPETMTPVAPKKPCRGLLNCWFGE